MINISLRQLRYFDALARSLHFGRAAQECAVTQPALSMQIQELEKELGAVLIERTRTGAKLTPEGREVARRTGQILASVRDLGDYARHGGRLLAGPLRLGVIPTIAPYILPKLLPALRAAYPDLDLHLREAQTQYVLADLTGGRLDAVLLSLPIDEPDIETLELFDDAFVLALPGGKPVPATALATPKLFENERLLLLEEGHCLRDQALELLRPQAGAEPRHLRNHEPVDARANGRQRLRRDAPATDEPRNRGATRRYPDSGVCAAGALAQDRAGVAEILAAPPRFHRAWRHDCGSGPPRPFGLGGQSTNYCSAARRKTPVRVSTVIDVISHPMTV